MEPTDLHDEFANSQTVNLEGENTHTHTQTHTHTVSVKGKKTKHSRVKHACIPKYSTAQSRESRCE